MRLLSILLVGACALGTACPSYGTTITADGVLQFYDNFEGTSVGSAPDNGANPGSWGVDQGGGSISVVAGEPAEGLKYLHVNRTNGADLTADAYLADRQGGSAAIHAEWMMYVPASVSYQACILLQDSDGAIRTGLLVGQNGTGDVKYLTTPNSPVWNLSSVTYTPDTWQKWTLDYTVGVSNCSFSVAGSSATVASFSTGEVGRLRFAGNPNGSSYYIDAVPTPEPATIGLLVTGALGLLAYAWRKHK